MSTAVLRSLALPDGSVLDGLNVAVVQRDQFVDPTSRQLYVNCSMPSPLFAEPYDFAVEASRIEVSL